MDWTALTRSQGLPTKRLLALSGDDCQQDKRELNGCQGANRLARLGFAEPFDTRNGPFVAQMSPIVASSLRGGSL